MMGPNDVVRLRNIGPTVWTAKYNSQPYSLQPGSEGIAPFIATCLWFGHPDAVDTPREKYRLMERDRLRVKYGVYDVDAAWETNCPKIEVWTLDGERVYTVLDDPEGTRLNPSTTTIMEKSMMEEQLARMEQQMKVLQAALETQNRSLAAEDQGDLVDEDSAPLTANPISSPLVDTVYDPSSLPPTPPTNTPLPPVASPSVSEDTPTRVRVGSRLTE